ncbi:hypothetical protein [Pseudomonas sp. PLMAX]|jgi:hypothetical protein|uniref:hypothetical protein n=1 Tax=Pseudomonas sp. PLMAX TaxID=2201998 RepID=UPI0038B746F2
MSNKKSQGQLRRELLMLRLRHSIRGIKVNCSGGLGLDDDLKRLIKEGHVKLIRDSHYTPGKTRLGTNSKASRISRFHLAQPADGVHLTTWPACPCCGVVGSAVYNIRHALNCSLRTDHRADSRNRRGRGPTMLLAPRKANRA